MGILAPAALSEGRAPAEVRQELLGGQESPNVAGLGEGLGDPDSPASRRVRRSVALLGELGRDGRDQLSDLAVEALDLARQARRWVPSRASLSSPRTHPSNLPA